MTLAAICPSDLTLERFLLGEMPEGAPDLAEHVATCSMCREALTAKRKDDLEFKGSAGAARIAGALAPGDRARDVPPEGGQRGLRGGPPGGGSDVRGRALLRLVTDRRIFAGLAVAAAIAVGFAVSRRHSSSATSAPAALDAREEQAVLRVQREWMEAVRDKDAAALDRILADDYTYTDSRGGVTNKADSLRQTRNPNEHMKAFHTSEETARVYGDVAIVTGRLRVEGVAGGQSYDAEVRFTDILARIDGRWRAVAAHASRAGESRSPSP